MELPAILDTDRGSGWMNDVVPRLLQEKNVTHRRKGRFAPNHLAIVDRKIAQWKAYVYDGMAEDENT